jgi:hypothetical protein
VGHGGVRSGRPATDRGLILRAPSRRSREIAARAADIVGDGGVGQSRLGWTRPSAEGPLGGTFTPGLAPPWTRVAPRRTFSPGSRPAPC